MWRLVKTLNLRDLRSKIERQRKERERRAQRSRLIHGRTPQFIEDRARLHFTATKKKEIDQFLQKTVVEKTTVNFAAPHSTAVNTDREELRPLSIWHTEGGWPKEINSHDADLLDRTKKKMQKEESFIDTVPLLAKEAEYYIRQNNTIDMCDSTRKNTKAIFFKRDSKPYANVVSVYRCPSRKSRPVSKIIFSPDNKGQMAVTYCPYEFDPSFREQSCEAFFWEVETPTRPECMVRASAQIVDVSYHPKNVENICGSLFTGQVAKWDKRVGPNPQTVSSFEVSHDDACTSAMWINSKSGFEFFSCGLDGKVIWWDERKFNERLDILYCDPEKGRSDADSAIPITVLDYEHTLPTKFLVGTQFGHVGIFMKKGKTPEERLLNIYNSHRGPVRSIHRNPVFIKNFMSCGDYHLRIFAEDCRDSGIIWTAPGDSLFTCAHWLPKRPCGLVASRTDGCLEFWDLLSQGVTSVLTTKVSEDVLSAVCPADNGIHVAGGTVNGDIRMVEISSSLQTFDKTEKSTLAACFDRESRREKYLEQRNREMRLAKRREVVEKEKESSDIDDGDSSTTPEVLTNENLKDDKNFFLRLAHEKQLAENKANKKERPAKNLEKSITISPKEEKDAKYR